MATDHELDEAGYGALFIIRGRQGGFPADHHQGDNSCHYVAEDNNYMGPRVVLAGDMDGDEYPDLVVGDYLSGWGDGRVYVVYTPESPLED
jgi:diadenosine tetraphosphatase ApaH/serine/threonine PP2A family protein phosphatase